MIDSHCHLADDAFVDDLEQVVARARAAGVTGGLCVLSMTAPQETERAPRVVELWPSIRFAIGVHPHEAGTFAAASDGVSAAVRRAVESTPRSRAIGEIGLDYHYDLSPRDVQREVFRAQVGLAGEMHLPVVIHTREAEADTIAILDEATANGVTGVLHCYTGTLEMARWAIDAGLYISFAGIVTFQNAARLREVAAEVPVERLLVETDCPYLAPVPHRGKRNEPGFVTRVAETIARLKGMPAEQFDEVVATNFDRLFKP